MFTAGMLDVFLMEGIIFNYVIGVSAGAAYGVSYVSGQYERNLKVNAYVSDKRYCGLKHLLHTGNFFNWDFIYKEIPEKLIPFDYKGFSSSATRMRVVVTNTRTGRPFYADLDGSSPEKFRDLLAATSSLPFVSRMKQLEGEFYMDGGIADPIPVHQAFADGKKRVVVILTRDLNYRKKDSGRSVTRLYYRNYPALLQTMERRTKAYNQTLEELTGMEKEGRAFVIRPSRPIEVSRLENNPDRLRGVYDNAVREAQPLIPALRKWLSDPKIQG